MALISVHNFLEPFKRPVHLVSICLLAGIVGVWRASGGSVELKNTGSQMPTLLGSSGVVDTQQAKPRAVPKQTYIPPKAVPKSDLDSLLKKNERRPQNSKARPRDKSALDDIEKTLGLRS